MKKTSVVSRYQLLAIRCRSIRPTHLDKLLQEIPLCEQRHNQGAPVDRLVNSGRRTRPSDIMDFPSKTMCLTKRVSFPEGQFDRRADLIVHRIDQRSPAW